jgi:serine/threonine protein kinase
MDLGGVTIVKLIGEGGMGRVYEARQEKPARSVAVKVIRQGITSEKTMRRFEREAEFLAKLQHPCIAQIYIVGTYSSDFGDVPFYVMEFIPDAKPITNYANETGLSLEEKLRLFQRICEAISHGHDRSIVHRDLKPGNILVDAAGNPKVIDFGVARSTDSDLALESMKTGTGQMIGTVQYMSPEQFGPDPDDLDGRTDVYSLGVVFYELLSGSPPYSVKKKALHEASRVVCEEVPPSLRAADKTIPRDVSAIAERCLQKDRRRRYHTAGELAADIGRFLAGKPVRAQPEGFLPRIGLPHRLGKKSGRRAAMVLIFGTAAVLGAGRLGRFGPFGDAPEPRQTARLRATSEWTATSLKVSEGQCYRLGVTSLDEADAGPASPATDEPGFHSGLLASIRDSRVLIPFVGGLTFVAPSSGELLFQLNKEANGSHGTHRDLRVTLEHVVAPSFVDRDGKTTITTKVIREKTLLFSPEGLQWQYRSFTGATDELGDEHATLINGIAWWPLPDKTNSQGWMTLTRTSRTPLLKTTAFPWAAEPKALHPDMVAVSSSTSNAAVRVESPDQNMPGITFVSDGGTPCEVQCVISSPSP